MATPSRPSFGRTLITRYSNMLTRLPPHQVHQRMMTAKSSLIKMSMPKPLKAKLMHGYRAAESHIFNRITNMPGEGDSLHNELGIAGMGTTFGQRMELKRAGMSEAKPINSKSSVDSDLYQSLMSRLSGEG